MGRVAIEFEQVGKRYALGNIGTGTLSRDLNRWWARIRGKEDPYARIGGSSASFRNVADDFVWALKEVSFRVEEGEVLGIIGRNGAGKSTLLKILSRITSPTMGRIRARGRIASLLEVGTGFHPEMTGRENIYMNGALMGMTKAEITGKLDEIIAFAGVERYIDTPVKRYSSGMTVRLGFAVAAHLEPEILVVDEVLAVGDAEFQRKAVGKMQEVAKGEGRTVLFVSHNMAAVKSLCTRGVVLQNGGMSFSGDISTAVEVYLENGRRLAGTDIIDHIDWVKPGIKITSVRINGTESACSVVYGEQKVLEVRIEGYTDESLNADVMLVFKSREGYPLMSFALGHSRGWMDRLEKGPFVLSRCIAWPEHLNRGILKVDLFLHHPMVEYYLKAADCCTLECEGYRKGFGNVMDMQANGLMGLDG